MKPGSKAWKMFIQKIYRFSISIGVLGLTFKFIEWKSGDSEGAMSYISSGMVIIGVLFYSIIQFLSGFAPINEDPNWELVYPELGLGHQEVDLDKELLSAQENQKYNQYRNRNEMNIEISKLREELDLLKANR